MITNELIREAFLWVGRKRQIKLLEEFITCNRRENCMLMLMCFEITMRKWFGLMKMFVVQMNPVRVYIA